MADYLLGYVSDLQLSNVWVVEQRHWATMCFVQDDWKVNGAADAEPRPALRLHHAGARGEQPSDELRSRRQPARSCSPATARCRIAAWCKPDRNNFAPRIGVVYKLDDKTVLRGGWGIFYNLFDRVGSEDQLALNVPGLVNNTVTQTSGSPVFFLQQGIPAELPQRAQPRIRRPASCTRLRHPRRQRTTRRRRRSTRPASASSASSPRHGR